MLGNKRRKTAEPTKGELSIDNRRRFLQAGTTLLAGAALARIARADAQQAAQDPLVRIGVVTDLHYADKPTGGSRHYRETLRKFDEAAKQFARDRVDFVIELGDFIDAADSLETERGYLAAIAERFAATAGEHHYVLGNHCVYTLTKAEFLETVGQPKSYYSFDKGGCHFVVLDACFRSDGEPYGRKNYVWTDSNIPAAEIEWLKADLEKTTLPTVAFVHQRLDVEGHYGVKNAAQVRQVLEASGQVRAVFQGHYHRNDHKLIDGIHYCTVAALVEGGGPDANAYAVVDLLPGGAIRVTGFGAQKSYRW
jgi:alkaline phosphatase